MQEKKPSEPDRNTLPRIGYASKEAIAIALMAAQFCRLPDRDTVKIFGKAVFPTVRKNSKRATGEHKDGKFLMYDDNTTPKWALVWSHGTFGKTKELFGWRIAHVWEKCNQVESYTRLDNLLLVPAAYSGLTDHDGPLAPYLRYHAYDHYGWRPEDEPDPKKPAEYEKFFEKRNYLVGRSDAPKFILNRLQTSQSKRAKLLCEHIKGISYWDQLSGKA